MNSFLDRVAGSHKNDVFDLVKVFTCQRENIPEYEEICNKLVSHDLEENMNALEYILGAFVFGKIVLGCDISNPEHISAMWNHDSDSNKLSYYDYPSTSPALTADTIQELAAVISGLIELEILIED